MVKALLLSLTILQTSLAHNVNKGHTRQASVVIGPNGDTNQMKTDSVRSNAGKADAVATDPVPVTVRKHAGHDDAAQFVQSKKGTCKAIEGRKFQFNDEKCGELDYQINDLMAAFDVEQKYWSQQGELNPWWAVMTNYNKGKDIGKEDKLDFYLSGRGDADRARMKIEEHDPSFNFDELGDKTAMDFGCGLARMSNAIASWGFKEVTCVDQSQTFLTEASKSTKELAGEGNVIKDPERIKFVQSAPDLSCNVEPESKDFVHSIITLQHMKPQLQVSYIEQFCDILKKGGTGYFGIPTHIGNGSGADKNNHCDVSYLGEGEEEMAMHYTPKDEVERHLKNRGCSMKAIWEGGGIGDAGQTHFFLFKKD